MTIFKINKLSTSGSLDTCRKGGDLIHTPMIYQSKGCGRIVKNLFNETSIQYWLDILPQDRETRPKNGSGPRFIPHVVTPGAR